MLCTKWYCVVRYNRGREECGTEGRIRNNYRFLVENPEGERSLGKTKRRWEDDIKMDLIKPGWQIVERSNLAKDRDKGRAVVKKVRYGNIWLAERLLLYEEHCSFELVNKILTTQQQAEEPEKTIRETSG